MPHSKKFKPADKQDLSVWNLHVLPEAVCFPLVSLESSGNSFLMVIQLSTFRGTVIVFSWDDLTASHNVSSSPSWKMCF